MVITYCVITTLADRTSFGHQLIILMVAAVAHCNCIQRLLCSQTDDLLPRYTPHLHETDAYNSHACQYTGCSFDKTFLNCPCFLAVAFNCRTCDVNVTMRLKICVGHTLTSDICQNKLKNMCCHCHIIHLRV